MPTTTFTNVTISIDAPDPKTAYMRLSRALENIDADYETDTYCVYPLLTGERMDSPPRDTEELFPSEEGGN